MDGNLCLGTDREFGDAFAESSHPFYDGREPKPEPTAEREADADAGTQSDKAVLRGLQVLLAG